MLRINEDHSCFEPITFISSKRRFEEFSVLRRPPQDPPQQVVTTHSASDVVKVMWKAAAWSRNNEGTNE